MVAGELDSVLATTSRCIPSAQAELACVCAQRFVHCIFTQLFVHPSLEVTSRSLFEQAHEPREPAEQTG